MKQIETRGKWAAKLWRKWDDAVADGRLDDAKAAAARLVAEVSADREPQRWTPAQRLGFLSWCWDQHVYLPASLLDVVGQRIARHRNTPDGPSDRTEEFVHYCGGSAATMPPDALAEGVAVIEDEPNGLAILARMSLALCKATTAAIDAGDLDRARGYLHNHRAFMAEALAQWSKEGGLNQ